MPNIAIILAGGTGSRIGANRPKQFIEVLGRPVLAYTIERFENHPEVDAIEVVCHADWRGYLEEMLVREGFGKVRWVCDGGETFQDSVINGIGNLKGEISDDDQILIHYGASPMVGDRVISDAIAVCGRRGNASPAYSQIYLAASRGDGESTTGFIDRDEVMCLNSPQALRFGYACGLYDRAREAGLLDKVDPHTASLMLAMGEPIYFSYDETSNIKITRREDLDVFEGLLLLERHRGDLARAGIELSSFDQMDEWL